MPDCFENSYEVTLPHLASTLRSVGSNIKAKGRYAKAKSGDLELGSHGSGN